jgi:hypothetical protein
MLLIFAARRQLRPPQSLLLVHQPRCQLLTIRPAVKITGKNIKVRDF